MAQPEVGKINRLSNSKKLEAKGESLLQRVSIKKYKGERESNKNKEQ
jgi:hypothetical protein